MLKAIALIILILLLQHSANANLYGQPLVDSLNHVLEKNNLSDSDRVDLLTRLCYEYRNLSPRKGIQFGEQAEVLAKKIHYESKLGDIYTSHAWAYSFYNDGIKAYEYALAGLKNNIKYNLTDLIPYSTLSTIYINPNTDFNSLRDTLYKILEDANKIKDKEWRIKTIGLACVLFINANMPKTGDSLANIAIAESREYNFKFYEMHNLARASMAYFYAGNYDSAISISTRVAGYLESIQEKRINGEMLQVIACAYLSKYKTVPNKTFLDSAENLLDRSWKYLIPLDYKMAMLANYQYRYQLFVLKGDFKKAISNNEKYLNLYDTLYGSITRSKLESIVIKQKDEINAVEIKAKNSELNRQKIIRNFSFAGIAILLLFSLVINNQRKKIKKEKQRSDDLLLNILPAETAEELKTNGSAQAKNFDQVTIMFTDFRNFTLVSEKLSAQELVNEINFCYSAFDNIVDKYGIEKIKTIGDSYMCAGGLPVKNKTNAVDTINAAIDIRDFMLNEKQKRESKGETFFEIRIGVHSGPVVAGIVGIRKFAYDIWGDTVNLASRLESSGEAGKINISGDTFELIKDQFSCIYRGKIQAKNKGEIDMYFVEK